MIHRIFKIQLKTTLDRHLIKPEQRPHSVAGVALAISDHGSQRRPESCFQLDGLLPFLVAFL